MPPRKPARRKPPVRKRKPAAKKNQTQLPVGLLFGVVFLLLLGGFMFLRLSGRHETVKTETPVVKQEHIYKNPVQQAPVQPVPAKPEPPKQKTPEPDVITAPPINENVKPEPEIQVIEKTVEKPVEMISVPNAVKLFMFDRGLKQDSITVKDDKITIETESEKDAKAMRKDLAAYLVDNKLEIISKAPLKAGDAHGQYTVSFSIVPPVKPAKPEKKPAKPAQKPAQQTVQKPAQPEKKKPEPIKYTAKLALVIDDCGYSIPLAQKVANMGYPATFAVIPYTPYGRETAKIAKKSGNVLFIHFPMQPKSYPDFDPGKGALFLNMPEALIGSVTRANMEYFGMPLDGANNHTGSAFTEDEKKMTEALTYISKYTGRFLDSHTSPASKAYDVCRKLGMQCAINNTFLDNEEPGLVSSADKQNHVRTQLVHAAKRALSSGSVIVIGHLRTETIAALPAALTEIEKMGVKIVPVTDLMN